MQHFFEDHSHEKEKVRASLVALADELETRAVTDQDVAKFVRFPHPEALVRARGRPLTRAEAVLVRSLLQQPRIVQSQRRSMLPPPDYSQCDCRQRQCAECSVANFVDFTFSDERTMSFPAAPAQRTGVINNIPFSIFSSSSRQDVTENNSASH